MKCGHVMIIWRGSASTQFASRVPLLLAGISETFIKAFSNLQVSFQNTTKLIDRPQRFCIKWPRKCCRKSLQVSFSLNSNQGGNCTIVYPVGLYILSKRLLSKFSPEYVQRVKRLPLSSCVFPIIHFGSFFCFFLRRERSRRFSIFPEDSKPIPFCHVSINLFLVIFTKQWQHGLIFN